VITPPPPAQQIVTHTVNYPFLFIFFIMTVLYSCKKEAINEVSIAPASIEEVIVQRVTSLSKAHQDYQETSAGKTASYEDMTVADALQTLEATDNYDFPSDEVYYYDVLTNNYTLNAATTDGIVSGAEILSVYDAVYDYTNDNITSGRILIVSDMEIDTEASTATNTVFTVAITTAIPDPEAGKEQACDFGSTDYWYPFLNDGKCDIYAPAYEGVKDGMDILQQKVTCSFGQPTCSIGATHIVIYNITSQPLEPIYNTEAGYVYYYFSILDCLTPAVLHNHKTGIVNRTIEFLPSGKYVKASVLDYGVIAADTYYYYAMAYYANYTCVPYSE
ncbi:MAG: hypothetical protein ACKVPJ_01365, partial [Chitinophagales bacterium]